MITPNDALQFIKDHHNGEIPYMFGKNEYARWMAEFANHIVTKHLHKPVVMQAEGSDGFCVSCEQTKITHELCLECAVKLGQENPKALSEGAAVGNSAAGKGVCDGHNEMHVTIRDGDFDYCMACNKQVPRA